MAGQFSDVQICSMALGMLGQAPVNTLADEANTNSVRCSQVFSITRDAMLAEHVWAFATKRETLALSATIPAFGFSYQFALPEDCLRVVDMHVDGAWTVESDFLLTDSDEAKIRYVRRLEEPGRMDPIFAYALAARIAMLLSAPILKKEPSQSILAQYADAIRRARLVDSMQDNPDQEDPEAVSSWLAAR
jgi:hypothetical protein